MNYTAVWIKGYTGLYKITNEGDVISFKQDKVNGKVMNPKIVSDFLMVDLMKDGKNTPHYIHRLVAQAFVKNPNKEKYKFVKHKDFNKSNNNSSNLKWTDEFGKFDRLRRWKKSEPKILSNLTQDDLKAMYHLLKSKRKISEVSKIFKIGTPSLKKIYESKNFKTANPQYRKISSKI